jgi:hypothetical protein
MPKTNNVKFTIGGPELTPGIAVARQYVIPHTGLPDLDKKAERGLDPAVTGENVDAEEYALADSIEGGIPISIRPCGGSAQLLKSALGLEAIPIRIGGVLRVRYSGSSASCRLVAASDRTHGIHECGLTGKTLSTATGLAASTKYYFKVTIDGGAQVEYDITTGANVNYEDVIPLMNAALGNAGAYFSIVAGDLRCTSYAVSTSSVIALAAGTTGTDLFVTLTGFASFDTAIDGVAGSTITLSSEIGAKGSESSDPNFGTAGSYDLTAAANDTLAELQALIAADTDYEAEILFGVDGVDTQNIIVFTAYISEMKVTLTTVLAGHTITINDLTFTAHAATTTPANREFSIAGATDTLDADELVTCINDATYGVPGVTAVNNAGVITLTAATPGKDAITVSTGDSTFAIATTDTSKQAVNMWAYILFIGNTSTAFAHIFTADLGNDEKPAYSIQGDGFQDNYLRDGCCVNTFDFTAALKGFASGNVTILGLNEEGSQTESALSLEDVDPLRFWKGGFSLGAKKYNFIRDMSTNINNDNNAEGYGQGTMSRQYHEKGKIVVTGNMKVRLDADSHAERAKVFNGAKTGISFYFKGKDIETSIPEMMLTVFPYSVLSNFTHEENGPSVDAGIEYKAIKPKGTNYNDFMRILFVTRDGQLY